MVKGVQYGSTAITARYTGDVSMDALNMLIDEIWNPIHVARVEIWTAEPKGVISEEEKIRGGDDQISICLHVELLLKADATELSVMIKSLFPTAEVGVYDLMCLLNS